MLTKKDLQAIGSVVKSEIKTAFDKFSTVVDKKIEIGLGNFQADVLIPYFDKYVVKRFDDQDKRFDEMDGKFDEMEERFDKVDRKLEKIDDRLDKHDVVLSGQKKAHLIS